MRLELDRLAGGSVGVVLADLVPVDDVVEGGDVLGAAVLVLEVVGVLPDVDACSGKRERVTRAIKEQSEAASGTTQKGGACDAARAFEGSPPHP